MSRLTRRALCLITTSALAVGTAALAGNGAAEAAPKTMAAPERPSRVLMVLFDQMRPEYADRFNMPNFRRLRAQGSAQPALRSRSGRHEDGARAM